MNEQHDRSLSTAIRKLAGTFKKNPPIITVGEVVTFDEKKRLVTALIDNGVELPCKLMADIGDGILLKPTIGSTVLIIYSTFENAYILLCSDLDAINLKGSELGGLVKVEYLTKKLNNLEEDLNQIKNVFSSWTPVPNDGGAALKTAASSWANNTLNLTNRTDIENENVTHGN